MAKRLPHTPRSIIRSALRQCWLRSRERLTALRATGYSCAVCGRKQTKARGKELIIEVHHKGHEPDWNRILNTIYEELLVHPDNLMPVCAECHDKQHGGE